MPNDPGQTLAAIASPTRHWNLFVQLVRRDIAGRYRGSSLGVLWSLINPLLMLAVYTFVFGFVFRSRWGLPGSESKLDFAIALFAGMLPYGIFSECMGRATNLVTSQPNYVKKVVFPLELMAWVALAAALFHALVGLSVLLLAIVLVKGGIPLTALLLPAIWLPLCLLCLGLLWVLSAAGVYQRDLQQIVGAIVTALMFLSPLFFPSSALPESIRPWLAANPLAFPIEASREVLVLGHTPALVSWLIHCALGLGIALAGAWFFERTRRGFADVL